MLGYTDAASQAAPDLELLIVLNYGTQTSRS